MEFNPIHFIPQAHKPQILSSPITRIHAIPHGKHANTNHWCFYLTTPTPSRTIQLDCQPTHSIPSTVLTGGSKANVLFSKVPYAIPPDAQANFPLDVVEGVTVQDVCNLLVEHGREKYEFDEDGVGCRGWVCGMLDLLFGQGFAVEAVQVQEAKGGIGRVWPEGVGQALDRGAYYE